MTKCPDCAFTIGTEASKSPHTAVVARLCAMTGERFDCHINHGACVGWAEEVAERKSKDAIITGTAKQTAELCGEMLSQMVRLAAAEEQKLKASTR